MTRRYGVIADGSLRTAYGKGEVKDRYWNPQEIFDEVHVLVLADNDIEPGLVQRVAGRARLHIHPLGRPRPTNLRALRRRALARFEQVRPDVIRGHGPFLQGYYATYAAEALGIPCVVSIHDDISIYRRFWTYGKGYVKITAYQLGLKALGWERYVYAHADKLVPKYQAAARLLRKSRYRDKVQVIYNQVHLERFVDLQPRRKAGERLRIINVGRQFAGKDQRPVIAALEHVDAELTLVGTGPLRCKLEDVVHRCGVQRRVRFIDSVPNHELPALFAGHHLFAIHIIQPGICMPVMEAMSMGFPIVINRPRWGGQPEVCGGVARVVDGTCAGYARAFQEYIADPELVAQEGMACRRGIEPYSGARMEAEEADLIRTLAGYPNS